MDILLREVSFSKHIYFKNKNRDFHFLFLISTNDQIWPYLLWCWYSKLLLPVINPWQSKGGTYLRTKCRGANPKQMQPPEQFCKKGLLKNFAKFTGNTCARVSFLIKLNSTKFLRTPFLQNTFERLLLPKEDIYFGGWGTWAFEVPDLTF